MSRIDEAMKRATGAPVVTQVQEVPPRADETAFDNYLHEPPGFPRAEPAAPPRPVDVRPVPVPAATTVAIDTVAEPGAATRENRLVGADASSTVPMEQYRRLAATLHDAQVETGLKTVMITSSVPQEGKTLTVVNLALTLSESYGRRVLLIDADLRRPAVHEVLGVSNDCGLGQILRSDRYELPLTAVSPTLSVLPAGEGGPNPLAGLTSEKMRALLDECASRFDWVLLDAPPVRLLADTRLLARLAHAVVLVVRARSTPRAVVEKAIGEIGRECIIGTVLNNVEDRSIAEEHYYTQSER